MMIKRSLVKKLEKNYPELIYNENGKKGYAFFESGVIDKNHVSEDYSFCEKVRAIGEKVYIDPKINLTHNGGNMVFYGNYFKKINGSK